MAGAFIFLCAFLPTAYGIDIPPDAEYGDAIISGSIAAPKTFIPILASDSASAEVCALLFNGLVKYDKDLRIVPELAESYEVLDRGMRIVFRLKKNVRWHDGYPFTAEDVAFTYAMLISKDIACPYGADFERIQALRTPDLYTVEVVYRAPFAPALDSWTMWILPKHLLKDFTSAQTSFNAHPVGTGPYVFSRYLRGQYIELKAYQDYFEGRPFIGRYVYKIVGDPDTMFLELQTGEIDFMGLSPLQYQKQTDTEYFKGRFNKFRYPSFGYTYLGFNMRDARFQQKELRQAINYAIDKQEVIDVVLRGLGRVATGVFPPQSWAYDARVEAIGYDLAKARALLEACGYRDTNNDGWREDYKGKVFEFSIMTNQGNPQRKMIAEIIQRNLARVGVKVTIRVFEWSLFLSEFVDKGRFETVLLGWSLGRDPDCYNIWHSSQIKPGGLNFIAYRNPEVDTLLEEARGTFDIKKRAQDYFQLQKIIYEDAPYIFLYYPDATVVVDTRFKNIEVAPSGIGHNFIRWYVPRREQKYKFIQ